jgi:hypothetical protein
MIAAKASVRIFAPSIFRIFAPSIFRAHALRLPAGVAVQVVDAIEGCAAEAESLRG